MKEEIKDKLNSQKKYQQKNIRKSKALDKIIQMFDLFPDLDPALLVSKIKEIVDNAKD